MAERQDPPSVPDPRHTPALRPDSTPAPTERRLDDTEVTRILRLASQADEQAVTDSDGVTVPQLAEAAREAGIDPGLVARAATVVEDPPSALASTAFGAPDTRTLRAFVPGRRIPENRDDLIAALEAALGRKGQIHESEPSHLLWKEDHTLGRTTLSLIETAEGTDVVLDADRAGHYLGSWFAGVVGWGLLATLTPLGGVGPAWAILAFLVVPFLLARPFWIRTDRTLRARLEGAIMDILGWVDQAPPLPTVGDAGPKEDASGDEGSPAD